MTENDQPAPAPDTRPNPPVPPFVAGTMTASGDLAVTPGSESEQDEEDQ